MLSFYPWEVMMTIRTGQHADNEQVAYELIEAEVMRPLMRHLRTKIAGIGVHNRLRNPHAHILLFSEQSSIGRMDNHRLFDELYRPQNKMITTPHSLHIEPVRDDGALSYLYSNLPQRSGKGGWVFFNRRLLEKTGKGMHCAA